MATGDYRIDGLLSSSKWNVTEITYSFAADIGDEIRNNVRNILENTLEYLINIDFVESTGTGQIHYSFHNDAKYAYAHYPDDGGDVFFNPGYDNNTDSNGFRGGVGTHGFETIIHETLHALGLKHPGNYNGEGAGTAPFLPYGEDNTTNTVMSYNSPGNSASTPMPYDILALQHLYGARNYNEGNTTYTFDSVYGFWDGVRYWGSATDKTKVTIWDSAGIDTLDFSSLSFDSSGYYFHPVEGGILTAQSALNGTSYQARDASLTGGYTIETYSTSTFGTAIAFGVVIENVIGSSSNDTIYGNDAANYYQGGNGNDLLGGWVGSDTLLGGESNDSLYGDHGNDYLEGGNGDDYLNGDNFGGGSDTLYGQDGHDTLYGGNDIDLLDGGWGDDKLYGEAGNDQLDGWYGNDYLYGSSDNDFILGWYGNDTLDGGSGNDELRGEGDDDFLNGWDGKDILVGGDGADIFFFWSPSEAAGDQIQDFEWEQGDKIWVQGANFGISPGQYDGFTFGDDLLYYQGTGLVSLQPGSQFVPYLDINIV